MNRYLKLLRVHHYIKNIIIFLPCILTEQGADNWLKAGLGACLFSLISSIIYIVNDIMDVEKDKNHPIKCNRPLASGEITLKNAKILIGSLFIIVMGLLSFVQFHVNYIMLPLLYLVLNFAYSFGLKNIALLDVFILMSGYLIRLEYGALIIDITVSTWMFLMMTSAAFFLGFGKRRNELIRYGNENRKSLSTYTIGFLNQAIQISMTTTIVFYAMACADSQTTVAMAGVDLLWSVPVVFIICLRYMMILETEDSDGDPVTVILSDKPLLALGVTYVLLIIAIIYNEDIIKMSVWSI